MEMESIPAQIFLHGFHQFRRLGRRDLPGGEAFHHLIFDRDQIAADGPIVGPEVDALGGCLQRGSARVMFHGIVAQQAEVGRIGPGGQGLGRVVGPADHARGCYGVHAGNASRFERRLAAQRLLRLVGTAVRE